MRASFSQQSSANRRRAQAGILEIDYGRLSARSISPFRASILVIALLGLAAAGRLAVTRPDFVLPFLIIALPTLAGLYCWTTFPNPGLPLLPIFLLQQGLVYGLPLLINHPELKFVKHDIVMTSAVGVGAFLTCCLGGWLLGRSAATSRPSRANLVAAIGGRALDRCLSISLTLLTACLSFHLLTRSDILFQILPGLERMFSVMRTFATSAGALGALFGGLAIGSRPTLARAWIYWALFATIFALEIADVLLSGAAGIVLSAAIGLALGTRKVPFKFLLATFAVVGFLNQGKFSIRQKYWGEESNTTGISLTGLPAFFVEWSAASASAFLGNQASAGLSRESGQEAESQSVLERVNNLQNMTYVMECFYDRGATPMMGETYALIPPLFVPRFLWADKPRAHEGQVRLNLHFGRQSSVEETEKTYVAWGLLPEGIGNFGPVAGPLILGLLLGCAMGWLETVSRLKRVFSVEGMALAGALLITATSYEYVASVFLTAMFQFVAAAVIGGTVLRMWAGQNEKDRSPQSPQTFRRIAP